MTQPPSQLYLCPDCLLKAHQLPQSRKLRTVCSLCNRIVLCHVMEDFALASVPEDKPLSISKAALALGVSVNTILRWEKNDKIKASYTPGGHRRFEINEIKRLLTARN